MYRKPSPQMTIDDFILPFSGSLSADNRWVQLAQIIPWDEIETEYAFMFPSDRGNVAKPVRMALGSLLIQARCGYTDRELVQQITENPYLQYFIGLKEYQLTKPFTANALVKFRKRFTAKRLAKINERIVLGEKAKQVDTVLVETENHNDKLDDDNDDQTGGTIATAEATAVKAKPNPNQGTLILDATCTPADMHFPTDLGLLNEARENLDEMIDTVHEATGKQARRPRTYRKKARHSFLLVSKQRSPRKNQIRQAIKKQLQYVKRNLSLLDQMLQSTDQQEMVCPLTPRQQRLLVTIRDVYIQQATMYKTRCHRVADRIVNLHQPHVRPIVRGKAGAAVEFGAKVAISLENGYSRIEKLSWDPYNEAGTLIETVERYRERNGCYPEVLLADRIYRNRDNLAYCKKYGIRLSGPKLGRPATNISTQRAEKKIERQDASARNAVEGKFGEGKRKYGLARIFARLKDTAECVIAMQFLVMNLERKLRILFVQFWNFVLSDRDEVILAV